MSDNEEVRAPKRQKTITNQDAPMPAPKPRVPSLKAPGPLFPSLQIPKAKAATGQTPTPQTPTLSTSPTQSPSVRRPEATVDICDDGDTVLVVSSLAGISKPMGIRVSSTVLTLASPVFKRLLSTPASLYAPASLATPVSATPAASGEIEARLIHLSDDGDSIYMLCNILHLQNDKLPTKIAPELLFRFIATSSKYQCLVAISRACGQWLDHIYHHLSNPPNGQLIFQLIETSMILNDAVYFARFTSKWVLSTPLGKTAGEVVQEPSRQRLAGLLLERQKLVQEDLKKDLDIILDPLAEALSEDARHYVDCAPGDSPTPSELESVPNNEPVTCTVDKEGSTLYLSALRDANLWPASRWTINTIQELVDRISNFRISEFDASEACYWCMNIDDKIVNSHNLVKKLHQGRVWGLCLDCYMVGGVSEKDCRVEHEKPGMLERSLREIVSAEKGPNKG